MKHENGSSVAKDSGLDKDIKSERYRQQTTMESDTPFFKEGIEHTNPTAANPPK